MRPLSRDRWQAVSPYLDEAMELDAESRPGWFARLRESQPEIAADLQALLSEQDVLRQERFLEGSATMIPEASNLSGQTLGSYTLVSPIGRGGMGTVWLASRSDGRYEGFVAIKLLDTALVGRAGEERFAREGSFLARLSHPNIAHLIDAGVSSSGQPYLVLERVEGRQIDRYCDEHGLGIDARVRLFLDVLTAVAHAHANLIVHRDIKPSNVLVSTTGTVKLLDFGIATLLEEEAAHREATMLTRQGGRALTPEFAAPEQMLGDPVTTATDVYSLGVLLYVLLTGCHPTAASAQSPAHLVKAIVDTVPARASEAVASADGRPEAARAEAAHLRASTPDKLRRVLRGDLDTIVSKALKKAPQDRYGSVTAFAEDVRRYLDLQPIRARPDTLSYRAAKFGRRHARAVSGGAIAVAVVAGLVSFYTIRLAAERDRAQLEAQKSAQVTELLSGLLTGADPYGSRAPSEVSVRSLLDSGAVRVREELDGQPELQAEMLTIIGRVFQRLAEHDKARPLLEDGLRIGRAASGPEHVRVAQTLNDLGVLARQTGDYPAAARHLEEALAMRRRLLGNEHRDVAVTLVELGRLFQDQGIHDRAEPLYRESLEIRRRLFGGEHRDVATSMSDLALLLWRRGDVGGAETLFREVLAISRKVFPPDHPDIASALNNLGLISMEKRDFPAAERMFRESAAIRAKVLAPNHPQQAPTLNNLGAALKEQGRYDDALAPAEQALAIARAAHGDDHPLAAAFRVNLARIQLSRRAPAAAEALARRALETRARLFAADDWRVGTAESVLGEALAALGRFTEAEPLLLHAHAVLRDVPGPEGRETAATITRLVTLYEAWGLPEKAARFRSAAKRN